MAQVPVSVDPVQFSCSICLGLLKDPVTIPCGHSYCMSCLTEHWDRQPVCSCPQCGAAFSPRPALGRNNLLAEMLQRFGAVGLSDGPSAPPLREDAGFVHATFDVSSVQPERTDGERLLGETRRHIAEQIRERELEVQQLKETLHSFARLAKAAVKDSSRIFSELLEFLERRRVEVKELIRAQEKAEATRAEATRAEHRLRDLERQISELRRRDAEPDRASRGQDDHLMAQQACRSCRGPVGAGASVSLKVSPHVSFGPVRRAVSDLKEQLQSLYHREFPSVACAVKSVNILQMEKSGTKAMESGGSAHVPALDDRNHLLQYFCPLSLDPFTAHRELALTEGNRVASRTGELLSYPDHPDRFDTWTQVLCREGLQGRSYWEAEWDGQEAALGLTYEDIQRKGSSDACRLGYNFLSWSLRCNSTSFTFCHGAETRAVVSPSGRTSCRIGVFLDYDDGLLCFYTVTPGGLHLLHKLETSFDRPLHPAAWLGARTTVTFCALD